MQLLPLNVVIAFVSSTVMCAEVSIVLDLGYPVLGGYLARVATAVHEPTQGTCIVTVLSTVQMMRCMYCGTIAM